MAVRLMCRAASALVLLPALVRAQAIHGTVLERNNTPVAGVVVQLLDSTSSVAARALSNERGEFRVAALRAGTYRVRTLRIGFRPVTSESLVLTPGVDVVQRIVVSGLPVSLDTVHVVERNTCRIADDSAAATFRVWEQVRTALIAAQLTGGGRNLTATTVAYERTLDPGSGRVRAQQSSMRTSVVREPWRSLPPDSLRRVGYVVTEADTSTFYAPALETLISDTFLEDHCFRLARSSDPSKIGIAFEPAADRNRVAEIRGTVWLDRVSSDLQKVEFRYANVSRVMEQRSGGELEFARMQNGAWVISNWNIRMPVLAATPARSSASALAMAPLGRATPQIAEIHVTGGELALVRRGTDTLWRRPGPSFVATVVDSLDRRSTTFTGSVVTDVTFQPVAGAEVSLPELSLSVVTNDGGAFVLKDFPAGEHRALVRRVGFMPVDTRIAFALNQAVERRFILHRAVMLDTVVTTASAVIPSFEENRRVGLGRFITRAELAKVEGRQMSGVLAELPGLELINGRGGRSWIRSKRIAPSLHGTNVYVPEGFEKLEGMEAACYAQVYLDNALMNPQITTSGATRTRATPPFDVNSIPPNMIEAVEYYAGPSQTPLKYSTLNSTCGVLVIWTRRSK